MKTRAWLICCLLIVTARAYATDLCGAHEITVFSCKTSKTKSVSVCASKNLARHSASSYVAYRFGSPTKLELDITHKNPLSTGDPRFYHYFRPQVDRFSLTFQGKGAVYSVFSEYDGDLDPEHPKSEAGVAGVTKSKSAQIACIGAAKERWYVVQGHVPCEDDDMNVCQTESR